MSNKEESSFLQGVESRLDSLFGEESEPVKAPDPVVTQASAATEAAAVIETPAAPPADVQDIPAPSDVALEAKESIREIPIVKAPGLEMDMSGDKAQTHDKSTFISEIEKRFSAIFGEEEKEAGADAVKTAEKPAAAAEHPAEPEPAIMAEAHPAFAAEAAPVVSAQPAVDMGAQAAGAVIAETAPILMAQTAEADRLFKEEPAQEAASTVSSIYNSPLKDMKSIVLSIEWEISDQILEQFEEEVNKLYLLYTGDRIIQGFLRILRFLGRYIRVRGVSSNQDSINLLLSVYDHLENVMITEGMTETRKHIILLDNIKKYRSWVESTDIETEEEAPAQARFEEPKVVMPQPVVPPVYDMPQTDKEPAVDIAMPRIEMPATAMEPESPVIADRMELDGSQDMDRGIKATDIVLKAQPVEEGLVTSQARKTIIDAMKSLSLDDAMEYAVREIKNIYQTELDALKEEIRVLRSAR